MTVWTAETTPVPRGTTTEDGEDPVGAATPEEAGLDSTPRALETAAAGREETAREEAGEEAYPAGAEALPDGAAPDGAAPDGAITPEAAGLDSRPRADEVATALEAIGVVAPTTPLEAAGIATVVVAP